MSNLYDTILIFLVIACLGMGFYCLLDWIENIPRRRAIKRKKTYFITTAGSTLGFMLKITCLTCGRTSYHPKDVENKYCGYCHKFHKD